MHVWSGVGRDSRLWVPIVAWTMGVVGVLVGVGFALYLITKYRQRRWGKCKSMRRLEGKIVVITGANSGIGKETARDLASRGAIVVLACRNRQAALEAVRDIRTTTGDGDLIVMELDLGDLASVRTFSSNLLEKFNKIDILINNAGVFVPPEERRKTKDGFEIHLGVNHLGHFLLAHLLLPRIQSTPSSRIIIVSSSLYRHGRIDFDNLDADKGWDVKIRPNVLYSNSKLANIFHSQELARRLQGSGTGVFVLCPGFVYTGLMRYVVANFSWIKKLCFTPIILIYMRNANQGAQTTIHCAISEELDGVEWGFLRECKIDTLEKIAEDCETATKLWDVSMSLVGERVAGMATVGERKEAVLEEQRASLEEREAYVDRDERELVEDEGITMEEEEEEEHEAVVEDKEELPEEELSLDEEEPSSADDDDELLVNRSLDEGKSLLPHQHLQGHKSK
ncbi:retinol dehydrogenase 11 [Procambarus clarkii]|uniref:retinol dehydrogenase 11 n=1 Tax=Procambarus clarkii TaxID=6728 RepID=UPI003742CB18